MIKIITLVYDDSGEEAFRLECEKRTITSILNSTLNLSAKDLYENLFKEVKYGENIEIKMIKNITTEDPEISKRGDIVFKIISEIIQDIANKVNSSESNSISSE